MNTYPAVLDELSTLRRVVGGESIARYGDGELKMAAYCSGIKSQMADPVLSKRLSQILADSGTCMVGIPNIYDVLNEAQRPDATPTARQKAEHWSKYLKRSCQLSDRPYVSAFITRPDSAPWIDTPEYWSLLESLWRHRQVTLVRGSGKSFTAERLMDSGAESVREIMAPRQHAWADYDSIVERIGRPMHPVILCLGPTATVMAVDLCAKGVHAVDLGHMGMFHKKHVAGEPLWVTEVDRAVDRVGAVA